MDYRTIIREQLKRHQEWNSRYSLRAFAKKLELSPSKLSEVMSGKRNLSMVRAQGIAAKLCLKGVEKEIFLFSLELDAAKTRKDRAELKFQLNNLVTQFNAKETTQRNAWYFGAVKALDDKGIDTSSLQTRLGLTDLQVENARRFLRRISKFFPDRTEISYEPISVLKRLETTLAIDPDAPLDADFLFLSAEEAVDLRTKIKSLVHSFRQKHATCAPDDLHMIHWGVDKLI